VPTCVHMCRLCGCECKQGGRFTESGFQAPLTSPSKPNVNVFLIAAAELNTGCAASAEDKSFTEQLAHLLLCSALPMTSRHRESASECVYKFSVRVCKNRQKSLRICQSRPCHSRHHRSCSYLSVIHTNTRTLNIHLFLRKRVRTDKWILVSFQLHGADLDHFSFHPPTIIITYKSFTAANTQIRTARNIRSSKYHFMFAVSLN